MISKVYTFKINNSSTAVMLYLDYKFLIKID